MRQVSSTKTLKFIGIDNVQTTMSTSKLYLFPFSSYMRKKTKHGNKVRPASFCKTEKSVDQYSKNVLFKNFC